MLLLLLLYVVCLTIPKLIERKRRSILKGFFLTKKKKFISHTHIHTSAYTKWIYIVSYGNALSLNKCTYVHTCMCMCNAVQLLQFTFCHLCYVNERVCVYDVFVNVVLSLLQFTKFFFSLPVFVVVFFLIMFVSFAITMNEWMNKWMNKWMNDWRISN